MCRPALNEYNGNGGEEKAPAKGSENSEHESKVTSDGGSNSDQWAERGRRECGEQAARCPTVRLAAWEEAS
jgi:hypothetical protein